MQRYKCIHCTSSIACTTQVSSGEPNRRRRILCTKCKRVADKYALGSLSFIPDLLLFKSEAFIHLLYNRNTLPFYLLIFLRAASISIDILCPLFIGSVSFSYFYTFRGSISFFLLLSEAFFIPIVFGRLGYTFRLFNACTLLSSISICKAILLLSSSALHPYLIDIFVSLLVSRAVYYIHPIFFLPALFLISSMRLYAFSCA